MTTALRFCLTLLLTLVALGAATGQGGKQKTPAVPDLRELVAEKQQSEFAIVVRRYDADRGNLLRLYTVPGSPARYARLKQFASAWLVELKELNPEKLSKPAQAEYMELRERVEGELRQLETQAQRHAEVAPLLPFSATIVELEESRRRLEKV